MLGLSHKGFNLIELLVTLAIIFIIAVIAIPTYQSHILSSRRADGKAALFKLAAHLERYYILHQTYEGATLETLGDTPYSPGKFYQLQISSQHTQNYCLTAIPINSQAADKTCGSLTLNHLGEKGITGAGQIEECWH